MGLDDIKVGQNFLLHFPLGHRFLVKLKSNKKEFSLEIIEDLDLGWYTPGDRFSVQRGSKSHKEGKCYTEDEYPEYFI